MSSPASVATETLVGPILESIRANLGPLFGHELSLGSPRVVAANSRPAGEDCVHVSFKQSFRSGTGRQLFGSLLVPLPDAICMACCLLMVPEGIIAARRAETTLDDAQKDALMEVSNLLGGAIGSVLSERVPWSVRSAGCQGVRAGVRPAFPYEEGSPLCVARFQAQLGPFEMGEFLMILPDLS